MPRMRALPTASRLGRPPSEEEMTHLRANVARDGFHVTSVPFRNGSDAPRYAYTTGLAAAGGHPELLIAGSVRGRCDPQDVLRTAARWILGGRASQDLHDAGPAGIGSRPAGRIGFRPVDPERCVLRFPASEAFHGRAVPVHQVLWADDDGRLPGEPGCDFYTELAQDPAGTAAAVLAGSQRPGPRGADREQISYTLFFEFPASTVEDAVNSLRIAGHLAAAERIKGARGWWEVQAAAPRPRDADGSSWYRPWERFATKFGGKVTGGEATFPVGMNPPEPEP